MRKSSIPVLMLFCLLFILPVQIIIAENKPIITVLDFTTEGVSENEMKTVISLLSSSLFQMGKFTVIDVGQRENILNEIQFSASGCSDDSCMLEIGMLLSAEMIVTGSMSRIGSRYVISTKLLETETGKTLGTADGIYNDLDMMVDDLFNIGGRLTMHIFPDEEASDGPGISETSPTEKAGAKFPESAEKESGALNIKKIGGIGLVSIGAIAAGAGGYFIYDAAGPQTVAVDAAWTEYDSATSDFDSLYTDYTSLYGARRTTMILGISLTAGGLLAAAGGAALLFLPEADKTAEITAAIVPSYQALGFIINLRY